MKLSIFLAISSGLGELTWQYEGLKKEIFDEHLKMWDVFRDPVTGLYCDSEQIDSGRRCGRWGNLYNQGATGWGLQVNCIEVELGIRSREEGIKRSLQTIKSFKKWPRDPCTGIFSRFTSRRWQFSGEWATIGSALATSGMMFAGNYFGGEVLDEAKKLLDVSAYDRTVVSNESISIMMVADGENTMSATNAALSEYAALAYLAAETEDPEVNTKCVQFHEKFHTSINGQDPAGMAEHGRPDRFSYFGNDVISGPYGPYSTFTPLFAWLTNKSLRVGEGNKIFWRNALNNWYLAELGAFEEFNSDPGQVMWSLGNNATDRGEPVNIYGKVFGCGAGSSAGGYEATTMKNNEFKTYTPHIMMAFLRVVDDDAKIEINEKLEYLWTTRAGRSRKVWGILNEFEADFLWRNSLLEPELQINRVEAVDYGSGLVGYAGNFLPDSWFEQFMI